jgi:hypothetical protein
MKINQIIISEGQKWPDISNSIADRNVVVPNLDAYHRGETRGSRAGRPGGMTVATRVNPSITSTSVKRLGSDRPIPSFLQKEDSLNELAPSSNPNGGNYLKALASAWYNGTFNTGDLHKGIKSQEDVERILERGIHCGDGKVRKYSIGYNAEFDGVEIQSDDHYEHADSDDEGNDIDSRTGQPWGPYDVVEFHGNDLDESIAEGGMDRRGFLRGLGAAAVGAAGLGAASNAQANQKDLGGGFVLTTVDVMDHSVNAVLDTQSNTYYAMNRRPTGGAIVRSMAPFIVIKNGQVKTSMDIGQQTMIAMKKAKLMQEGEQKKDEDYIDPPEADYDDDYQDMVKRVGQKAKQQELTKQKSKEISEATDELNKILRLSGNKK